MVAITSSTVLTDGTIPKLSSRTESFITNMHVSEAIVKKELMSVNLNKSLGPNEIHPRLLAELADFLSELVTLLFNKSILHGVLPREWKEAYISPIYKKGSNSYAENYRPISLTCTLSKLLESFVKEVLNHLLEKMLLSKKQYGFISGRSTTTQLLKFLAKCMNTVVNGSVVDTIYFDFKKAFDTVPHRRLLGKLEAYGIKGKIWIWISEFLTSRSQLVIMNGEKSTAGPVLSSIPQGTVPGPLLFVIYINHILENITSEGFLFADDTII